MGAVYAATDLSLERIVALKLLRQQWMRMAVGAERFRSEARIAASFTHPNVVTIHDFGFAEGGEAFLVMELLRGVTLRERLSAAGRLPLVDAEHVLHGVCAAVDAAHRRMLVHGDLKPENIFLARTESGEAVKVLDFGLARSSAPGLEQLPAQRVVGTPCYMAPGQILDEPPIPAWDVWALTVLAYELTGSLPFSPAGTGWPRPIGEALRGPLESMQPFFERALALEAARRPQSARLLLDGFTRAARATAATVTTG
jgi:serine/threonine protein kinase